MPSTINADNGVVSGSSGVKTTADTSGVLALQSNGSTGVTLDTSLNVGVGTTTPTTKLAVAGGISGTAGANISGAGWGVLPYVANSLVIDNNAGESRFFATGANTTTDGSFLFYTGQTDGGANLRATINSSGYLTVPNQPAFSQIGSNSFTVNTTGDLVFTSSNVWSAGATTILNTGSNFNLANGRFTAPVTGNYMFILSVACAFSSGYFYLYFFKNGAALTNSNRNFSQNSQAVTQSIQFIIPLTAGDYVSCATNNNFTGFSLYAPWFCGYLMS